MGIGLRAVKPEARAEGMRCVSREAERIPSACASGFPAGGKRVGGRSSAYFAECHSAATSGARRSETAATRGARRSETGDPEKGTTVGDRRYRALTREASRVSWRAAA